MKILSILMIAVLFFVACSNTPNESSNTPPPKSMIPDEPVDDGKGVGEVKQVALNNPLDEGMVKKGESIYEMKCAACHKLTAQRVVGPGWKGLTEKRKPEWIMNMITNVEMMLAEDATAQALLEECLVRMPNQNVSNDDARSILEFMLKNDETK